MWVSQFRPAALRWRKAQSPWKASLSWVTSVQAHSQPEVYKHSAAGWPGLDLAGITNPVGWCTQRSLKLEHPPRK